MKKIDVSVALLAGVSCFAFLFAKVGPEGGAGIPVWAIFIGWAWYFAILTSGAVFKTALPPMLAGSVLAIVAIALINLLAPALPWEGGLPAIIIAVIITVFLLMLTTKIPAFSYSLVSFNAYSCMFAGYYAHNFPTWAERGSVQDFGLAFLWITGANFIGLLFGLASVKLSARGGRSKK